MEPVDSRTQAPTPDTDHGPVVFDMVPLGSANGGTGPVPIVVDDAASQHAVDPPGEMPLSTPDVHPPIGSAPSRLEAALLAATSKQPAPAAPAVPSPSVVSPPPPSAASPSAVSTPPPPPPPPPPTAALVPPPPPASAPIAEPAVQAPAPSATSAPGAIAEKAAGPNADQSLTLPSPHEFAVADQPTDAAATSSGMPQLRILPMIPLRCAGVGGAASALLLSAWQVARVIDDQARSPMLSWGALITAMIGAIAVVVWTWVVTENARRMLSPARTQEMPDPAHAALTWLVPMAFIAGAAASVTYLSAKLNTPSEGTESSLPLLVALAAIVFALPMMYSPITYLSSVVRKIGGHGIRFAEWIWVSVALAGVGVAMIVGLRLGGVFGDDVDGLAPAWVIGVATIVPAVTVVYLGWRAAGAVESDVVRAFDRRRGVPSKTSKRRGKFTKIYADGGPNHAALRQRGYISQLPGGRVLSIATSAVIGGLALLSLIGAIVMFLFWQETRDGVLLPTQTTQAWDLVDRLRSIERSVVLVAVAVASAWSFVAVTNVRLASARRRNPVLAAAAWPVAAAGIWIIGSRFVADGSTAGIIVGFVGQALCLALPFFLLYRSAGSIGTRRQSLRITWAIGVILLVHVQGLGGLSTVATTADSEQVARLVGYLAIGALLQLLAMFASAAAMRAIVDTAASVAARHNTLVMQRRETEVVRKHPTDPPPRMSDPEISGVAAK